MKSRRLKVSYQSAPSQEPYRVLPPKPFLRLQGRWLDKAGFAWVRTCTCRWNPDGWCWK